MEGQKEREGWMRDRGEGWSEGGEERRGKGEMGDGGSEGGMGDGGRGDG